MTTQDIKYKRIFFCASKSADAAPIVKELEQNGANVFTFFHSPDEVGYSQKIRLDLEGIINYKAMVIPHVDLADAAVYANIKSLATALRGRMPIFAIGNEQPNLVKKLGESGVIFINSEMTAAQIAQAVDTGIETYKPSIGEQATLHFNT